MAGFGGSVKLTGESEYRQALQRCTQNLKTMSNALKNQTADFNSNDKSMKNTAQAQKQLNDTIQKQQQAIASAKNTLAGYSTEMTKQTTLHNQLNKEYKAAVVELDKIKKTSGENSTEYKKQAQVVDELGKKLSDSAYKLDENKSAMASLKSEINSSNKVIANAKQQIDELGKETEESGEQAKKGSEGYTVFKNILANLGTQAINSAINGLKNLGATIGNVGKDAINSFGEFEQLEGGVKKLFGDDAAKTVMDNANKAFSSAGMSANEYMNTVTSFSASLISGLNGDTQAAAKISDMAIRDMSDNANTFGTDISMIQNAYQGFAKGNFTMLDNLKLGYGGTQSEMARLINESGVLGDSMKVTAETVKNVPFDKMIEAIHKTQEEMKITGTTANEASYTIQGSTNSMKAAWQNMLTGMADENANFEELATNFISTLITEDGKGGVLGQIIPRIATVIDGMSNAISTMLPTLIQQVVPIIEQNLPIILTAVQNALATILEVLPEIMPVIANLIPQIVNVLLSLMPDIINAGIEIIINLIAGITNAIPQLTKMLPTIIKQICDVLIKNLPLIIKTGIDLLVSLIKGLSEAIPQLVDYIPEIVETIVTVLIENLPMLVDAAIQLMIALTDGLIKSLPKLATMVPRIITTIVSTLISNLPQILQAGVKILNSLISGIGSMLGSLGSKAGEIGKTIINKIKNLPQQMLNWGKDMIQGLINGIKKMIGKVGDAVKGVANKIKNFLHFSRPDEGPLREYEEWMPDMISGLSASLKAASPELINQTKALASNISDAMNIEGNINGNTGTNTYYDVVAAFKDALSEMKIELDDENMGKFIDKTVARTIYS